MQHLEGSGTPVLYMGRKVLKGFNRLFPPTLTNILAYINTYAHT